ncbi:MAG: hypothetical protein V2B18_09275 [Pseudomonadota bacterium]
MAGTRFLSPIFRLVICSAGMVVTGHFLYQSLVSDEAFTSVALVRGLVFLGFTYLFARTLVGPTAAGPARADHASSASSTNAPPPVGPPVVRDEGEKAHQDRS